MGRLKKNSASKALFFVGSAALTVAAFITMPSLIKKCSSKIYKASATNESIDIDSMEPEIVHKEKATKEEE